MNDNQRQFFEWARERYEIHLRKSAGMPRPWTKNEAFNLYHFCNVHREMDKTTIWFKNNIRDRMIPYPHPAQVMATAAFRCFNRVETWETILEHNDRPLKDLFGKWDGDYVHSIIKKYKKPPYTTGSYMIPPRRDMDMVSGVIETLNQFAVNNKKTWSKGTMEEMWKQFRKSSFIGDFTAYEFVCDLRYTPVLANASDINTWANVGPGSCRGMNWTFYNDPNKYSKAKASDREIIVGHMVEMLEMSRDPNNWPSEWPAWELREVEHWACEVFKLARFFHYGGRNRKRYIPS